MIDSKEPLDDNSKGFFICYNRILKRRPTMRTVHIKINSTDLEMIDALNTVIFDVHHDFADENIRINVSKQALTDNQILIDDELVSFECKCKDDPSDCHCSPVDKIRKALFKAVNWRESGCGCGGNCGCH